MKKINSARKPKPIPIPLTKTAIVYGMGVDSPDQYVFMPNKVFNEIEWVKPRFTVTWTNYVTEIKR